MDNQNYVSVPLTLIQRIALAEPYQFPNLQEECKEIIAAPAQVLQHNPEAKEDKNLERAKTLLKAAHELLRRQREAHYVLNILSETVHYDDAECDGGCLMEDIGYWIEDAIGENANG